VQLLAHRQGDAPADGVYQHGDRPAHGPGARVCAQLQRAPRDERHGWSSVQQLNIK
jgi:hypothetical protein